jgi:hypothetical protein
MKEGLNLKYFLYNSIRFFNYKQLQSLKQITNEKKIGVVFQGPIKHTEDFTRRTLQYYLESFPDLEVVLSTWESEDIDLFENLLQGYPNFSIIQSEKPAYVGIGNLNLQIVSTFNGLEILEKKKVEFVLKMRTDQCLYDEFVFLKLKSTLTKQAHEEKIIFVTAGSFLLRLYGPSDFMQFGRIDKIKRYWSAPLETEKSKEEFKYQINTTLRDFSMAELCEVYLGSNYLRSNNENLLFTLRHSLEMHRKYFFLISQDEIGFFWNKYTFQANKWTDSDFPHPYLELSETLVIALLDNSKILDEFEFLLDMPFDGRKFLRP